MKVITSYPAQIKDCFAEISDFDSELPINKD